MWAPPLAHEAARRFAYRGEREINLTRQMSRGLNESAAFRLCGGPMAKIRAILNSLGAVASLIVRTLMRVAKRWAAPGAGPKLVSG
jgi:hypothetical protein